MKKIYSIFALGTLMALASCSKDDIDTYSESEAGARFLTSEMTVVESKMGGTNYSGSDDMYYDNYSFLDNQLASSYDCDITVVLIGKPAATDRTVGYEIINSTAPEGSYEIVESVIPADSIYGHIRVKLYNVEELCDSTYELTLRIVGNDQLAAGPKEYVTAHLTWNNQIPEPPVNNLVRTYNMLIKGMASFISTSKSCYSPNALRAIVAATGWNDWDDYSVHGVYYNNATSYKGYKYLPRYQAIYADNSYKGYAAKVADWLAEYEKEHGTKLLHDAGSLKGKPVEARAY